MAMKRNKEHKLGGSPKPTSQRAKPARITAEQEKLREWNRLMRLAEYQAKLAELHKAEPNLEKKFHQAINALHDCKALEEWFAKNTPYPFKIEHRYHIPLIASCACGYLKKMALSDNQDAIKTLARLSVDMTETLTEFLIGKSEAAKSNEKLIQDLFLIGRCFVFVTPLRTQKNNSSVLLTSWSLARSARSMLLRRRTTA